MIYEIYKNVRNSSWKCILECGINSLPTNLSQICKHYDIRIIRNSSLKENYLLANEKAKNMFINGQWYIIVDDSDYITVQRYSIAHEIGIYTEKREQLIEKIKGLEKRIASDTAKKKAAEEKLKEVSRLAGGGVQLQAERA